MTDHRPPEVTGAGGVVFSAPQFELRIELRSNFWINWARIAIAHEEEARRHRAELVRAWGEPGAISNMQAEMAASMVALVGVAFVIDAIHFDVAPLVGRSGDPRDGKGSAWGFQLDTFRIALPTVANTWQIDMKWLADVRREAVHPQPVSHEPRPHPALPTDVAIENLTFSAESATRAVGFLMTLLEAFLVGKEGDPRVLAWGHRHRHVLDELRALRPE